MNEQLKKEAKDKLDWIVKSGEVEMEDAPAEFLALLGDIIDRATLAGIEQGKKEVLARVSDYVARKDTPKLVEVAVLAERQRCAEIARSYGKIIGKSPIVQEMNKHAESIATAIEKETGHD
jgi:vacuolar-type H+-ATPase subunit H